MLTRAKEMRQNLTKVEATKTPHETLDALRRKSYGIALLLGSVVALINLIYSALLGQPDPFQSIYLPVLAGVCLILLAALWLGKRAQKFVESGMCIVAAGSLLSRLYYGLYIGNPQLTTNAELSVLAAWFPLTYILYYLVIEGKPATVMAWLSYAVTIALGIPYLVAKVSSRDGAGEIFVILQIYTSNPAYIILLTVLSVLKERYVSAEADVTTMTHLAMNDELTGLYNRRYIEESLACIPKQGETNQTPVSIIMLDIDHFKEFNDRYSHESGDVALRIVGKYLRTHVRDGDIVGRYGGEEFTIIMPGATLIAAHHRAEYLREGIQSIPVEVGGQVLGPITFSLGVAVFPEHGPTGQAVLQVADAALYHSKQTGRNRVTLAK